MSVAHKDGEEDGHGNVWHNGHFIPKAEYAKIKHMTKDDAKEHH